MNKRISRTNFFKIIAFFTLIFSQNITWRLIQLIPHDPTHASMYFLVQIYSSELYVFLTIVFTSSYNDYSGFLLKHPSFTAYWSAVIAFLSHTTLFIMYKLIPNITTGLLAGDDRSKQFAENRQYYQKKLESLQEQHIKGYWGLLALSFPFLVLSIICPFINANIKSWISDGASCLTAIIGGIFTIHTIVFKKEDIISSQRSSNSEK